MCRNDIFKSKSCLCCRNVCGGGQIEEERRALAHRFTAVKQRSRATIDGLPQSRRDHAHEQLADVKKRYRLLCDEFSALCDPGDGVDATRGELMSGGSDDGDRTGHHLSDRAPHRHSDDHTSRHHRRDEAPRFDAANAGNDDLLRVARAKSKGTTAALREGLAALSECAEVTKHTLHKSARSRPAHCTPRTARAPTSVVLLFSCGQDRNAWWSFLRRNVLLTVVV